MNHQLNRIKELEKKINLLESKLLNFKAKLSRLKNPDFPHYTEEELDAMFDVCLKKKKKFNEINKII